SRPLDSYFCSSKKRIRSQMVWFFNMLPFLSLFFRQLYRIHVIQYLIEVIENMSQQMDHGYLKKESDPRIEKSNSSYASKALKWGLFGGAALAITYAVSKLSDKSHTNSL
ncbi:hypothetical protein SC657_14555, partial [Legionella pneumophila]